MPKAPVPKRDEKPIHGLVSDKNFIVANAVENILAGKCVFVIYDGWLDWRLQKFLQFSAAFFAMQIFEFEANMQRQHRVDLLLHQNYVAFSVAVTYGGDIERFNCCSRFEF